MMWHYSENTLARAQSGHPPHGALEEAVCYAHKKITLSHQTHDNAYALSEITFQA